MKKDAHGFTEYDWFGFHISSSFNKWFLIFGLLVMLAIVLVWRLL